MDYILEIIKVIFLGIVEGITEWLPISSTGHMILFDEFVKLNVSQEFKDLFFVVIQLGAIFAVIVLFWERIWPFTNDKKEYYIKTPIMRLWIKVLIATLPTVIIALPLNDVMEKYLYNSTVVSIALIVYGVLFIIIENKNKSLKPRFVNIKQLSFKMAFFIGLFQVLATIPGTSRSGSTILGAIILGCSRTFAAEFSFFLAIPTMFGASLLKVIKYEGIFGFGEWVYLSVGMIVSFLVSYLCINFLMNFVKRHDFKSFGYYRIILGLIVLTYGLTIGFKA